jgi:hypothetical protein
MTHQFLYTTVDQPQSSTLEGQNLDAVLAPTRSNFDSNVALLPFLEEWNQVALELERQLEVLC